MKQRFQIIGEGFLHTNGGNKGYSVHGKESKYLEWSRYDGDAIFYIDEMIPTAEFYDTNKKKYAWVLESKAIKPEPVEYIKNNLEKVLEVFDIIFVHDTELLALGDKFKYVPPSGIWIKDMAIHPKIKFISMISSNKGMTPGHQERLNWINKLSEKVDLYGRGFKEIDLKEQGLSDYMFSVAIENCQYNGYFTEKILDCFATGTIPIYLGCTNIDEYFNPEGIINLSEDLDISPEIYYNKMDAIKENFEKAKAFEIAEDYMYERYFSNL
jgi:hypothetical protein